MLHVYFEIDGQLSEQRDSLTRMLYKDSRHPFLLFGLSLQVPLDFFQYRLLRF
ncbi:hypothetical protein D3C78_700550 [compost metagenome]